MRDVSLPRRPARVEARNGTRAWAVAIAASDRPFRSARVAETGNARATSCHQRLEMAPPPLFLFLHRTLIFVQPQDEIATVVKKHGDLSDGTFCLFITGGSARLWVFQERELALSPVCDRHRGWCDDDRAAIYGRISRCADSNVVADALTRR
jgi:hypothetical protein